MLFPTLDDYTLLSGDKESPAAQCLDGSESLHRPTEQVFFFSQLKVPDFWVFQIEQARRQKFACLCILFCFYLFWIDERW